MRRRRGTGSADETADSTATGVSQPNVGHRIDSGAEQARHLRSGEHDRAGRHRDTPTTTAPATTAPAATSTMSAPAPAPKASTGLIVPLYSLPSDPAWAALIAAKKAHASVPVIAVIDPNNGPGTAARSDYMRGSGS